MKIEVERLYRKPNYTIGKMYVDGVYFCDTLEDKVRDLFNEDKVPAQTAIPAGVYQIDFTMSARLKRELPILLNVPFFEGIRIHKGNTPEHTEGCILIGENKAVGKVINSTGYEFDLCEKIKAAKKRKEKIVVRVV